MIAWAPWVGEAVEMIGGFGEWAQLPEAGGMRDQSARDMMIYAVVRKKWLSMKKD